MKRKALCCRLYSLRMRTASHSLLARKRHHLTPEKGHETCPFCVPDGFAEFRLTALKRMAGTTGLEPAASAVTGQRSNQLNYVPRLFSRVCEKPLIFLSFLAVHRIAGLHHFHPDNRILGVNGQERTRSKPKSNPVQEAVRPTHLSMRRELNCNRGIRKLGQPMIRGTL